MTFQPTLPARGATYLRRTLRQHRNYFNPRSPHGERRMTASWKSSGTRFQPTLPARGATGKLIAGSGDLVFQPTLPARGATRPRWRTFRWLFNFNPRSPHGERHKQVWLANRMAFISTHAPRTGSDRMEENQRQREAEISTHAPRTGSDLLIAVQMFVPASFQPTLPARGATGVHRRIRRNVAISTHAPRTGSDNTTKQDCCKLIISTHAPRTGSDAGEIDAQGNFIAFQPTLPARGATCGRESDGRRVAISTHAPRTGSDKAIFAANETAFTFQPTLPARGATSCRE